jgi:hypothetical protein
MNLATVVSPSFYEAARGLVKTFRQMYADGVVYVYYFNGAQPNIGGDYYIEVPQWCSHAHDTGMYFFKTYAIYDMMQHTEPFLYLDAHHRILSYPYDIDAILAKQSRFFVSYPKAQIQMAGRPCEINIGTCTTNKCLELMCCATDDYRNAELYWAAIQAWLPTDENRRFANEFLEAMKNIQIAGPSNKLEHPEGVYALCRAHRNDQSVLSVLIKKYGWQQTYNEFVWERYGDHTTINLVNNPQSVIKGRCKEGDLEYNGLALVQPANRQSRPLVHQALNTNMGVVVSFCTNDKEFFDPCIREVQSFAKEVVVSYGNLFFDGTPEDIAYIEYLKTQYPQVVFKQFVVDPKKPARFNHDMQRAEGYQYITDACEHVMFIDIDEIVEANKFVVWWNAQTIFPEAMRFATYYYMISPALQANIIDCAAIVIAKKAIDAKGPGFLMTTKSERDGILKAFPDYVEFINALDNNPMFHHYSLVRTKEEMLKKVTTWGHNKDKSWDPLVRAFFDEMANETPTLGHVRRCVVVHTEPITIHYNSNRDAKFIPPYTRVDVELNPHDRKRIRAMGLDVIEYEIIRYDPAPIVDFWHNFEYHLVEPYLKSTKYVTDHNILKRIFKQAGVPAIDKTI